MKLTSTTNIFVDFEIELFRIPSKQQIDIEVISHLQIV